MLKPTIQFEEFPKMARLHREVLITEKIDGTNATIFIDEVGNIHAGSRTRWITPEDDNFGFAKWVAENSPELRKLGPGLHRGEWWGNGIQRNYGLKEKRFSLFNVLRWADHGQEPQLMPTADPRVVKLQGVLPTCCHLVPLLYRGPFDTRRAEACLDWLSDHGSKAAPGFMKPEGIVVFHTAANIGFKQTLEKDHLPKSLA
jgi:hypothetical protein